jgi:hypothetical protein
MKFGKKIEKNRIIIEHARTHALLLYLYLISLQLDFVRMHTKTSLIRTATRSHCFKYLPVNLL